MTVHVAPETYVPKSTKGQPHVRHGMSSTPEYLTWSRMIGRCYSPQRRDYERWGGRGIRVEERWHTFENFFADMGLKPTPQHSLERLDNAGHYGPENCIWATPKQQARNRRNNRLLTHQGETLPIAEWADRTGINRKCIQMRLRRGWSVGDALSLPTEPRGARQ